jgi:hypothetical protein
MTTKMVTATGWEKMGGCIFVQQNFHIKQRKAYTKNERPPACDRIRLTESIS